MSRAERVNLGIGERRPALTLAGLYAILFVVVGLVLPFWPVWLKARGLDATQISLVLTAGMLVRVAASPVIAFQADRRGEGRRPIALLALLSAGTYAAFAACRGLGSILAITLLTSACFASLQPLTDTLALRTSAARGFDYGRVRLWGSLSFILVSYAGGAVLARFGPDAILGGVVVSCAVAAALAWTLPESRTGGRRAEPIQARAAMRLVTEPRFLLFVASASLIQASHGVYYAFGTLNWQRLGYPDPLIGALWGLGVVAEIALFAVSGRMVARGGPAGLILLGGFGGVVRWGVTAFDPPLSLLIPVQALHALTFGATFLGAIHYVARTIPPGLTATAQSLLSAASAGVVMGAATLLAGWAYGAFGSEAYLAMAALSAFGGLGALRLAYGSGGDKAC